MLLQVMKPVFHFINHREKLEIKIWATKSTKRPCTARRTMSFQKLMYVIFFSTQGPPIQITPPKGRCVTGTFNRDKVLKYLKHRGSYMSAHVLLNLLNELGKRDKMRGLPSILSLFGNEFNKFNNTRARM